MKENYFALISYANQSKGPVPSGLMLEGLPHLAGTLLSHGYIPRIFDYNSTRSVRRIAEAGSEAFEKEVAEEIINYIRENDVKVAGFTLYNNGLEGLIRIASKIKADCPKTLMIAGGPVVNYFEDLVYGFTDVFDVLAVSEGYGTIKGIADYAYGKISLSRVPNLIFKGNKRTKIVLDDFSKLPFPVYDKEFYPDIDYKIHIPVVRGTVGCRYGKCTFCVQPKIDGKFRVRNKEDLLNEIIYLQKEYGFKNIRLSDPNPYAYELEFLSDNAPFGTKISAFSYSDTYYDFEKTSKILSGVFLGVESFNPKVLLQLNKTDNPKKYVEQVKRLVISAKNEGIASVVAIMVPVANDTAERIQRDYEFVKELNPDFVVSMAQCPVPGTKDYNDAIKLGEASGFRLSKNYVNDFMRLELDLLRPASSWPTPPWELKVDGEFSGNPFHINAKHFMGKLKEDGFEPVADENVLMAYVYYGSLPKEQAERRRKIIEFNNLMRDSIAQQDFMQLEKIVEKINMNQSI